MKRQKRSLSTGPRAVTDERDVLTTMSDDIRRSSLMESPLSSSTAFAVTESTPVVPSPRARRPPRNLVDSGGSTSSSSELKKSVHFDSSVAETPNAPKRLTLGDRLKLIKAQSTSLSSSKSGIPPVADRDPLRRASVDIERLQEKEAFSERQQSDEYAQTISTDQPFARELAQLRTDLRKSDFKREKFVAPVTESISTVLFDSKGSSRRRTSDDAKSATSEPTDRLSQNYYLLPTPRKTKDFVVTGKDCTFITVSYALFHAYVLFLPRHVYSF
jgi:hypothetical protein